MAENYMTDAIDMNIARWRLLTLQGKLRWTSEAAEREFFLWLAQQRADYAAIGEK